MCFLKKITDTTAHESTDDKNKENIEENRADENEENREVVEQSASKSSTSGMQK